MSPAQAGARAGPRQLHHVKGHDLSARSLLISSLTPPAATS